jgi:hypothetical protein
MSDEIPHGTLPSVPVLELASQVARVDVHSDVVGQLSPDAREEEVVPRSPDATTTLSSSLSIKLVSSASGREESLIHQFVAHDKLQNCSPLGPLIARFILVEAELVSEMERLDQNEPPSLVTQAITSDDHGDNVLVGHEYTHINPKIRHDLELWRRIHDYDVANAEMPFTPVLSKKHKQQVKKQLHIGKPPYRTRSRGSFSN